MCPCMCPYMCLYEEQVLNYEFHLRRSSLYESLHVSLYVSLYVSLHVSLYVSLHVSLCGAGVKLRVSPSPIFLPLLHGVHPPAPHHHSWCVCVLIECVLLLIECVLIECVLLLIECGPFLRCSSSRLVCASLVEF